MSDNYCPLPLENDRVGVSSDVSFISCVQAIPDSRSWIGVYLFISSRDVSRGGRPRP